MIRRFASRFLVLALTKGKQDFLATQYKLDPQVIEAIAEYDPSPNNAYTAWLCKVYKDEGEDLKVLETLRGPITKFMKLINSPDFPQDKRDIGKYDAKTLVDMVGSDRKFRRQLSQTEIERQIMSEGLPGATMIWNANNFKMWHVTNINYAMFLGSNTRWCTAQPSHARNYCASGGLFPVYYKNKPFCQGHINESSGGITFLNKEDRDIDITDTTFLTFIEVVDVPEVRQFANRALGSGLAGITKNLMEKADPKSIAIVEHLKKMVLKFKNANAMVCILQGLAKGEQWWPERVEFLLDYPSLLLPVLATASPKILDEIKNDYPELAEEILYEAGKGGKYLDTSETMKFINSLSPDPKVLENYFDENMTTIDLDNEDWPELITIFTKKVEALPEGDENLDLNKYYDFFNTNSYNDFLKDAAMIFWRKFIKTEWGSLSNVIGTEPDYQAAIKSQMSYIKAPKVGTIVTTTPNYTGDNAGETGEITASEDAEVLLYGISESAKLVTVKWGNGKEEKLGIVPGIGDYLTLEKKQVGIKGWKVDSDQTMKVGDKVTPSSNWDGEPERVGKIGTLTLVEEPDGDNDIFVDVKWDDTGEESHGWFNYRFTKVIASKAGDFPKALFVGQKVKVGPTWTFGNQHNGVKIGTVKEDDHDGWFQVSWEGSDHTSPYRYGVDAGGEDTPFMLDIIPADMEFELPKVPKGKVYDWDNVDKESKFGKEIIELSATLAEEYGE